MLLGRLPGQGTDYYLFLEGALACKNVRPGSVVRARVGYQHIAVLGTPSATANTTPEFGPWREHPQQPTRVNVVETLSKGSGGPNFNCRTWLPGGGAPPAGWVEAAVRPIIEWSINNGMTISQYGAPLNYICGSE